MSKIKELLPEFAILRRVTGLTTIKGVRSRPALFSVSEEDYKAKSKDAEGEFISQYDNNVLPKATTRLAPFFNEITRTYWPEGQLSLLHLIVNRDMDNGWRGISINYPKGHHKEGMLIKAEDIRPDNFYDSFFFSDDLTEKVMKNGTYTFKCWEDPLDALLYVSYMNNPKVIVRDGSQVSSHKAQNAQFELVIPQMERTKNKASLKKEFEAIELLGKLSYDKQKSIAYVMELRLESYENPDPDALYIALANVVKSTSSRVLSKWGMTERDKFVQLCKFSNSDLAFEVDVKRGFDYRILEKIRNEYRFNSELLENVHDHNDLIKYFKSDNNVDKYNDLLYLIEEKSKGNAA